MCYSMLMYALHRTRFPHFLRNFWLNILRSSRNTRPTRLTVTARTMVGVSISSWSSSIALSSQNVWKFQRLVRQLNAWRKRASKCFVFLYHWPGVQKCQWTPSAGSSTSSHMPRRKSDACDSPVLCWFRQRPAQLFESMVTWIFHDLVEFQNFQVDVPIFLSCRHSTWGEKPRVYQQGKCFWFDESMTHEMDFEASGPETLRATIYLDALHPGYYGEREVQPLRLKPFSVWYPEILLFFDAHSYLFRYWWPSVCDVYDQFINNLGHVKTTLFQSY